VRGTSCTDVVADCLPLAEAMSELDGPRRLLSENRGTSSNLLAEARAITLRAALAAGLHVREQVATGLPRPAAALLPLRHMRPCWCNMLPDQGWAAVALRLPIQLH
jgi:hypothetical protein